MKILKFSFLVHLQSHYYKLFYPEVLVCFTFFFFLHFSISQPIVGVP